MGKFLKTKDSDLQGRIIKKTGKSLGKSLQNQKSTTDHDEHLKKVKRKLHHSKDLEPPLKKLKVKEDLDTHERTPEDSPNEVASEFQDIEIELRKNESSDRIYLKLVRPDEDLFADDVLKARYDQFTKFNFIFHIFDEIALEGLDGITIEAYWTRLKMALKSPTCIDFFKEFIWHIICSNERIMFFELPEPRENLIIFSRDAFLDKETNTFTEVYQTGPDIYKIECAPARGDIWGSCATLSTRVDISEQVRNMTLDEAYSIYKNKLVMVAHQTLRVNALFDELTDPNYEYTQTEYCLLERIGRSRELGEITQGSAALPNYFGMDSKSLFHYCKGFRRENLVTKQFLCVRSTVDQSKIGRLLQLRRFYTRKKSKYMLVAENIINYLKKCPEYKAPYRVVKAMFCGQLNLKFFKNQEFLRFVDTQVYIPHKEYHPDATFREYMTKNLGKERVIHLMQLKDPFVNIAANWSDCQQPDSSDDEDDDHDDDVKIGRGRILNMEFIREVYLLIHSRGKDGCTTQEVNAEFDVDFATTRSVLKKLIARKLLQCTRQDMGRQKPNQYVATCFIENPKPKINPATTAITTRPSSVIERLKEKQQKKIDSLDKDRVYTREKFEADRQLDILRLSKPSLLPVSFTVPQIICEYLISKLVQSNAKETVLLAEFTQGHRPFKINLTCPKLDDSVTITLTQIAAATETDKVQIPEFSVTSSNSYSSVFKADYLTKACLLQAHFGDKAINCSEVLDLLEPNLRKSKAMKRERPVPCEDPEPQASTSHRDSLLNTKRVDLANYMGPNPILISREEDDFGELVSELYLSTPPAVYKTGEITEYEIPPNVAITERILSRMNTILKTVNATKVFEEVHKLLRVIFDAELEEGYDKKMDRKSLHRIMNRLATEGYIKLYQCIVSNKNVKKSQNFICHPDVDHRHETIRNGIDQIKFRFVCVSKKQVLEQVQKTPQPVETSPFGEYDVMQSIQEIKELRNPKVVSIKTKWCRRAGKLYGHRPKFARMSLLHEILFHLIYVMDKDTKALPEEDILELFRSYKIKLTDEDLAQLPPVYCREISWKMFIPPLPRHLGWEEGWTLICDIILRIPVTLMVRLYCLNFLSSDLQEILLHPIKRFYLIKNLPAPIQYLVMYKRKCIFDLHFILVRLAYCGLLQFGPARFKEKEQGFIYLNRKASLLETMSSDPGYHKVSDKHYNKVSFYFDTLESVSKYWFTMHNICMSTLLNARHVVEGKTITFIDVTAKPSLNKAVSAKTQEDVEKYDNGDIPGDNRGAAGLDSAMWSHFPRNWIFFAQKSTKNFRDELALLKMDQVMPEPISFQHLQLPMIANKFYLGKPHEVRPSVSARKIKLGKTSKKMPVIRKLVPPHKLKINRREYYDAVDKAIIRKYNGVRFRPTWMEEEDKVVILLKVASTFLCPGHTKQLVNYSVMRDILHRTVPESRSKTSRAVQRRFKVLARDVPFMTQMQTMVYNLYKLVPVAQYFVPLRNYIAKEEDGLGNKFKLTEPELSNAFVFLAYYMVNHRKEVETALHGNLTTMDYFNKETVDYMSQNIVPVEQDTKHYQDPVNLEEIRKYVLKDIFHSALGHKTENPAWSYQMYKVCQKFNQDTLKKTFDELRDQHMMTTKKQIIRKFFNPYKLSLTYVFAHATTFTYHTMEEAYTAFSELKNAPETFHVKSDLIEENIFGQMFGLNEVITFVLNQVKLKFWFPEHHFILNPAIEDHSPVIDELAKRYQAKMKHSEKDADLQDITQTDSTFTQITEPEAGPSTTTNAEDIEIIQFDDDEPLDLTITSTNSTTITNLKHWISDCIDAERVRSPSPELLTLDVNHDHVDKQQNDEHLSDDAVESREREEKVLTLEEIKEEILRVTPPNEKRKVPYITDLAKLLSDNFDDIETDEQTVDEMKKHFVQQYPRLEELDAGGFSNHYLAEYLENRPVIKEIWNQVERETHVADRSKKSDAFDDILENGGTMEDIELASEIIYFISEKGSFGATASELKEKFDGSQGNCSLENIIKKLTYHKILLRTGVCTIIFVHYNHQNPWLADTFTLTDEHVSVIKKEDKPKDRKKKLEEDIDERLGTMEWIKVKPVPWAKVDGTLDKALFKLWLSSVLSYCIENPKALLTSFFDKFCFLKPVDLFYLTEVLQDLGCLEMRRFQRRFDLFSGYECNQDCKATFLDKFEEIYMEPNQISFCALGSFLHV